MLRYSKILEEIIFILIEWDYFCFVKGQVSTKKKKRKICRTSYLLPLIVCI